MDDAWELFLRMVLKVTICLFFLHLWRGRKKTARVMRSWRKR
jgi:hypothetical protein